MKDKEKKGRRNQFKGEQLPQTRLTEAQVREIRGRYEKGGITQPNLSIEYNVSLSAINKIINRKYWKHIGE